MTILFVGRSTFDLGYVCANYPEEDAKHSATHFWAGAGGCALNAAVTARALGSEVKLLTLLGTGPFADAVRTELAQYDVPFEDFATDTEVLPVSSIIVVPGNASRTIVDQQPPQALKCEPDIDALLAEATLVLTDGWLPALVIPLCRGAREQGIPVVLDGGSVKPWSAELMPLIDYAVVSNRFQPEFSFEVHHHYHFAMTRGAGPISWYDGYGGGSITPPQVEAVDTLGAGDVFHGAFCHYLAKWPDFPDALEKAAVVAAESCRHYGARAWIGSFGVD
ncbi:sugar kinase [Altererythrobacter salegens]|uniref:Sugar kinase n=1 Tax=Croceibacterium salegens TaxID=1737568 RepID=A0A6I4T1Y5_9SPHN|nr:PfkB family carbohydrate kinase [Croceibacterium salegens]MXO61247.1 sugar kinase [Croceibacterium salegens]